MKHLEEVVAFISLCLIISFFLIVEVHADDTQLSGIIFGDDQLLVTDSNGDLQLGNLYFYNPAISSSVIVNGGFLNNYYNITVKTNKQYTRGQNVTAIITIRNSQRFMNNLSRISYYLSDSHGNSTIKTDRLPALPPDYYDRFSCRKYGGDLDSLGYCVTTLKKSLIVPKNAKIGNWKFNVVLLSDVNLYAFSNFKVVKSYFWWYVVAILIILGSILFYLYKKKKFPFNIQKI